MPVIAMLLATLFWSSTLIGNKILVDHLAISEVVLTRFGLAALLLWLLVALSGEMPHLRRAGPRPVLMGLLEPGLTSVLFIWGQSYTSAAHATVFWALMPVMMPVLGRVVLGETLRPVLMVAAFIALGGTLILLFGGTNDGGSLKGDLLCMLGVLCGCANQLLARRVAQSQGRPMLTTALQLTSGALLALAILLLIERPEAIRAIDQRGGLLALMLYLGFVASALPFFLYNYALRHIPVGR
ncbi:MAG: EamA family transporter, partial [Alphaproteobacteria bacterium]|nr:EamA family transporter [Alphaproteobacteria bacterium]